jgi:hypothetical protein
MADDPLDDFEAAISDLRRRIQLALVARDYERASALQTLLRESTARCERLHQRRAKVERGQQVAKLEQDRESEQRKVLEYVERRLWQIRSQFAVKYTKLERRHAAALTEVQTAFTSPIHLVVKLSSIIDSLQRAEAYYVRTEDYESAGQVRWQLQRQSEIDFTEFETVQRNSIEARIRDAMNRYHTEQQTFAQRLHNQANLVRRDANRKLAEIDVKYRRLYHQITGSAQQTYELNTAFNKRICDTVKRSLREFAAELHKEQEDEQKQPAVSSRPQSERSPRSFATHRSPRATSSRRPRSPRVEMALARANQSFDLAGKIIDF